MDLIKENAIKFIDAMLVDNYSKAHKFLEVIVNEKVKEKIAKAIKDEHPFKKKNKSDKKKSDKKKKDSKKDSKKGKFPFFLKKGKKSEEKSK